MHTYLGSFNKIRNFTGGGGLRSSLGATAPIAPIGATALDSNKNE